jgi:fatty acid-binding protein DegV
LVIVHSAVEEQAVRLKNLLGNAIAEEKISIAELGASLGAHGGPGVLLAAIRRAEVA